MRSYRFAAQARQDLFDQIDYLIDQGAADAAARLLVRVESYVRSFLCVYPGAGRVVGHRGLWETWVSRTRLVIWYRFDDDSVEIVRVWHAARDRSAADE